MLTGTAKGSGLGVLSVAQVLPFHRALAGCKAEARPTARHSLLLGQETPTSSASPEGGVVTVQLLPFQISATAVTVNPAVTVPVAMQSVVLAQDTLSRVIEVDPAGMTGCRLAHDVPSQTSAIGRAGPTPPTARQKLVVTHDNALAAPTGGRRPPVGSSRQDLPFHASVNPSPCLPVPVAMQ
jgi:hypothetical protein